MNLTSKLYTLLFGAALGVPMYFLLGVQFAGIGLIAAATLNEYISSRRGYVFSQRTLVTVVLGGAAVLAVLDFALGRALGYA